MEGNIDLPILMITDLEIKLDKLRQERCCADSLPWTEGCITKDLYLAVIDTLLMSYIIQIEVMLAIKNYFRATSQYEKVYSLKSPYVVMLEGYKRLKGFSKQKNNLWERVRPTCMKNSDLLKEETKKIETLFENFEQKDVTDREFRDMFTHYDVNVIAYCDSLYSINFEDIIDKYHAMTSELLIPLENFLLKIKFDIESFCPLVKKSEIKDV